MPTSEPPRATSWRVFKCAGPECHHPHLGFLDDNGRIIADAVIDRDHIDKLAAALRAGVAQIDAEKGHRQ